MIKEILKQISSLDEDAFYEFQASNPLCFKEDKGNWLYPMLCAFFKTRGCSEEIKKLLKQLGTYLHENAKQHPMWEVTVIDKSQCIDDSYVEAFIRELQSFESDKYHFKDLNSPYKTKRFTMALKSITKNSVMNLMHRFGDFNHPYILAEIANSYILSGDFTSGLNLIYRCIKLSNEYPNKFWNSEYGLMGCANALRHAVIMCRSTKGIDLNVILSFLKLYYLYTSKLCNVSTDDVIQITAYANRSDIAFSNEAHLIFPLGCNPKLLYISDLYYANFCNDFAPQYSEITGNHFFQQSIKYYQHASLWPNDSGGYVDIEDDTYNEIVNKKHIQAIAIAYSYFKEYEQGTLRINKEILNDVFRIIANEIQTNYKSFYKKVLNFKENGYF